jgi:hypothetical protein
LSAHDEQVVTQPPALPFPGQSQAMALGIPPQSGLLYRHRETCKPANLTGSKIGDDIINDPTRPVSVFSPFPAPCTSRRAKPAHIITDSYFQYKS